MNNISKIRQLPVSPLTQVSLEKTTIQMRMQKKPTPEEGGNDIWFLTLSDLLMLLMIFFVLLFGMALKQQNTSSASPQPHNQQVTPVTGAREQPTMLKQVSVNPPSVDATASLASDLTSIIGENSELQGITVARHAQYVVLTFPEQIVFDSGQAQFKLSAQPVLEKVAVFIQNHSNLAVEIQGHTDNQPIANRRYPSNWELSADRATQVAKSLVHLGIDPTRISTRGFGEYHPLYPNNSDYERLKNRRVELQFSFIPAS